MRRFASAVTLLVAVAAQIVLTAPPANAWYVDVSLIGAGRVVETTDAGLLPPSGCVSPSTTPTGTLGASCRAGTANGPYGSGWVVRYVAEPAPGYRFAHWASDGRTSPTPVQCDGANGAVTYTGTSCQFATWDNLQVRAVFVDDTNPVLTSLTGPNAPANGPATFTFSAQADPTFRLFECRVAGVHDWQTCTSGRQENPSASGSYTFEVRAVDHSGNRSAISLWQWTVDKLAPETIPGSGPSGTVASTSATFNFSSNEPATYECSLDAVLLTSCGSPKFIGGLGQGTHVFTVRARDGAGNFDQSPATWMWTVDTVAPETQLTSAPATRSTSGSASFGYTSTGGGTGFVCTLDDTAVPCANPYVLDDGEHTFTVAARDAAGNVDASPATHTWTVDTIAPGVVSRAPTGRRVATRSNVAVTFSEAMREAALEASRDGRPRAITLSLGRTQVSARVTYAETATGAFRAVLDPARRLRAGREYKVAVTSRALDLAGNAVPATSWRFRTKA